jgi:hypothetical protein
VPSDAAHAALHAHWQQQIDGDPAVRAAFAEAVEEYVAWLRAQLG